MESGAAAGQGGAAGGVASQAPGAGGTATDVAAQQQQPDAQQQQPAGLDPQLLEQIQGIPGELEQMRVWMEQQAAQQQQPQDPMLQEPDLSFIDPADPRYDPQQAASQLLQQMTETQQRALTEAMQPLQQEIQDMRFQRDADALAADFPELQDEATANAVLQRTAEWVRNAGLPEEHAANPQIIRNVYLAGRALELQRQEGEEQAPPVATLEGAGGASPGGASSGGLTAESIVGAGGRNPLPFG